MDKLLNGKELASSLRQELKKNILSLKVNFQRVPSLTVILVGNDKPSSLYVRNKEKACEDVGIKSKVIKLDEKIRKEELLEIINSLNSDEGVDAILLQSPLPEHLNYRAIIEGIDPQKDVDCFHPNNLGLFFKDTPYTVPCTPKGIIRLIKSYNISLEGKVAIVIGRSLIVGKPLSVLLLKENCTVISCHSKTKNLSALSCQADIVISAIGKAKFITENHIKEGAVVIDVGMNYVKEKLVGDVDFEGVFDKVSFITPVPGGVGPMTIYSLLENCYEIFLKRHKLE